MKIIIFISLITQFVFHHENFNVPKAGEFFSNELGYQPPAVGAIFMERMDLTGSVFGRLTVVSLAATKGHKYYLCKCSCGNEKVIRGTSLSQGQSLSCGCHVKERVTKHGYSGKSIKEYRCWASIKTRCYNKNTAAYPDYGGRGIRVCERWLYSFLSFLEDMGPSPSPQHTIERSDSDGDYSPENCRWATRSEQNNNKRDNVFWTYKNRTLTISQWATLLSIPASTLYQRHFRKWPTERILSTPYKQTK